MENKDRPAAPIFNSDGFPTSNLGYPTIGLSKLEYFTAKAMEGLCANPSLIYFSQDQGEYIVKDIKGLAKKIALEALSNEEYIISRNHGPCLRTDVDALIEGIERDGVDDSWPHLQGLIQAIRGKRDE